MKPTCSIIIPTYNNPDYINPCIDSIRAIHVLDGLAELIIVNNGKQPLAEYTKGWPNTRVLEPGRNLGWEGGLQYGLEHSDTEYVCFQNDDTIIPMASSSFYSQLLWPFNNKNVAAVGPATTIASGWHSIFLKNQVQSLMEVPYLIFFTVMMRRDYLDEVGGIDTSAPGGDDFDLSIRLRKAGKHLLINPHAFLIHHGFKTGERVRGNAQVSGGWNSKEMIDKTNQWLIQKHGFKEFTSTMRGFNYEHKEQPDLEGDLVSKLARGPRIIELGCGFRKTLPQAIGIDVVPKGEQCNHLGKMPSVADIAADVSKRLPLDDFDADTVIARHILEHMPDLIDTLRHWNRVIKMNGTLIVAVPNQELRNTIPLNPEHVHAFTPLSLIHLMEVCGFKVQTIHDPGNGISVVGVFEKVVHMNDQEKELVLSSNGHQTV